MATKQEYAQLSLYVYNIGEGGNPLNRPDLPQGWTRLEYQPDNLLGLSYGVFYAFRHQCVAADRKLSHF